MKIVIITVLLSVGLHAVASEHVDRVTEPTFVLKSTGFRLVAERPAGHTYKACKYVNGIGKVIYVTVGTAQVCPIAK